MSKFFKNIVGTVAGSDIASFFKPNNQLIEESAKYFIIKDQLKENNYYGLIYSEGIFKNTGEYCKRPQYFSHLYNDYTITMNNDEYFATTEVLKVDINN